MDKAQKDLHARYQQMVGGNSSAKPLEKYCYGLYHRGVICTIGSYYNLFGTLNLPA